MLGRVGEAERVVMEVLPHLGEENLQMFAALLASIKMRERRTPPPRPTRLSASCSTPSSGSPRARS
jgi:hypothetical protein